jgi:SAM-dependent methyltransferase
MPESAYWFGEDTDSERERLASVQSACDVQSQHALREAGVGAGWHCWEVGAGRGSLARWLAGVVGADGHVLATDLDDRWFDPAGARVTFVRHDVTRDPPPGDSFDLVHARFVLEHLADPGAAMARLAEALRPDGVLVLEDAAGLELTITPSMPNLDRFVPAWERAGRAAGWNATYGNELMSDLRLHGLRRLMGRQYRQLGPGGEQWVHLTRGIERLRDELTRQGVTRQDISEVTRLLADPAHLIVGPPVTIAWGRSDAAGRLARR